MSKNVIKEAKNLSDTFISDTRSDTIAMLDKLKEHGVIKDYTTTGQCYFNVIIDDNFNWDNSHNEVAKAALMLAHTYVLGLYTMFMVCSDLHVRIVDEYRQLLEQQKEELENLRKPKSLIITPGSSLL